MYLLDLCLFSSLSVLLTELSPRSLNIFICAVFEESLFFYTNLLQLKSAEFNQWNIGAFINSLQVISDVLYKIMNFLSSVMINYSRRNQTNLF